jgi:hypothetical protein
LAELKAAQMEALHRQRELEEREGAELHAELELRVRIFLFFLSFFLIFARSGRECGQRRSDTPRSARRRASS